MYFWEEDKFVEIKGKVVCLECAQTRPGFEYSCYGKPCTCDHPTCRTHRDEDLSTDPEFQAFLKAEGIKL